MWHYCAFCKIYVLFAVIHMYWNVVGMPTFTLLCTRLLLCRANFSRTMFFLTQSYRGNQPWLRSNGSRERMDNTGQSPSSQKEWHHVRLMWVWIWVCGLWVWIWVCGLWVDLGVWVVGVDLGVDCEWIWVCGFGCVGCGCGFRCVGCGWIRALLGV